MEMPPRSWEGLRGWAAILAVFVLTWAGCQNAPARRSGSGGSPDADGDGLSRAREEELGTDPNNPDSDGDGLLDHRPGQRADGPVRGWGNLKERGCV